MHPSLQSGGPGPRQVHRWPGTGSRRIYSCLATPFCSDSLCALVDSSCNAELEIGWQLFKVFLWSQSKRGTASFGPFLASLTSFYSQTLSVQEKSFHHFPRHLILAAASTLCINMPMLADPSQKYRPFPPVNLPNRQWPSKTLTRHPRWLVPPPHPPPSNPLSPPIFETAIKRSSIQCRVSRNGDTSKC